MEAVLQALLIFALRVVGISLSTVATILTVQGRKLLAVLTGSLSTFIYVVAIAQVVTNLRNVVNVAAYVAGFGVGTWVGMLLEERMALGFSEVRIISSRNGDGVAAALRAAGFGVTQMAGQGRAGSVSIVDVFVPRRSLPAVLRTAEEADPQAIVMVSEARSVQRAYWRPSDRRG
ncbi:MAG: DUF5698 domain-containing protein [Anaerolineae bacterium]|nr:DUF5698 domain-containing protein [Anaerolineae bacterium]MDW8068998.1 DUF5698 domain-containing protein [Anaerolineae bacterium]